MRLRIVVPCYNEELRLEKSVKLMIKYLRNMKIKYSIMLVNDGSKDNTLNVMRRLVSQFPNVQYLSYDINRGKGYAVRAGVMTTPDDFDYICFSDADGSSHLRYLVPHLGLDSSDVVITNRDLKGSQISSQSILRWFASKIFIMFRFLIVGETISDTQNGEKGFKTSVAKHIFSLSQIDGFSFDVEILHIAKKHGYRIDQVPVVWNDTEDSRVHIVRDSLKMLRQLFTIRWNSVSGYYDLPCELKL